MVPKHEVKRRIRQQYKELTGSDCNARTCENCIARGRVLLLEWSNKDPKEHQIEAVGFYTSVIQHPGTTMLEKMRARERLDALYGLDGFTLTVKGGANGGVQLNVQAVIEEAQKQAVEYRRQRLAAAEGEPHVAAGRS
jgi:hypothetical protein